MKVDYVRAYLPADEQSGVHKNNEVTYTYSVGNCITSVSNNISDVNNISIYPNPAKDILYVKNVNPLSSVDVCLYNSWGQAVVRSNAKSIDVSHLPGGIYIAKISTGKKTRSQKILIKQ